MGGRSTLTCSHLGDFPCHKPPQAHHGVRGEGGGVLVVWGSGRVGAPVSQRHVPSPVPKGPVGFSHEFGRGNFVPGGGGASRPRGRHVRASCRGRGRCGSALTGRYLLIGCEGTPVRQLRGI